MRMSLSSNIADNLSYDNREGYFAGLVVKFPLHVVLPLNIETSLLYNKSTQGIEQTTISRDCISIPINAQLKFTKHTFLFVGPQLDFDITDKDFYLKNISSTVRDYSLKDANVSVNAGVGVHAGKLQLTVNFNKALGAYSDVNLKSATEEMADVVRGSAKADSWCVGLTYFF